MDTSRAGRIAYRLEMIAEGSKENTAAIMDNAKAIFEINTSHKQVITAIKELTEQNKRLAKSVHDVIASNQILEIKALGEIDNLKERHNLAKQENKEQRDQSKAMIADIESENKQDRIEFREALRRFSIGFEDSVKIVSGRKS